MITFATDLLAILLAFLPLMALAVIVCVTACALQRNWPRLPQRLRIRRVPSRNPDGRPLTPLERERLAWIEDGYARTAAEPGEAAVTGPGIAAAAVLGPVAVFLAVAMALRVREQYRSARWQAPDLSEVPPQWDGCVVTNPRKPQRGESL